MLDPDPKIIGDKRLLGVVPGKPGVGDRKEPAAEETVMVWPNLLVRHAVAALVVILVVVLIAVFFDAPLREIANPLHVHRVHGAVDRSHAHRVHVPGRELVMGMAVARMAW